MVQKFAHEANGVDVRIELEVLFDDLRIKVKQN